MSKHAPDHEMLIALEEAVDFIANFIPRMHGRTRLDEALAREYAEAIVTKGRVAIARAKAEGRS